MTKDELLVLNTNSFAKDLFDVLKANTKLSNAKILDLIEKVVDVAIKPQHAIDLYLTVYTRAVAGGVLAQQEKRGLMFARGKKELMDAAGSFDDMVSMLMSAQIEAGVESVYAENEDSFIQV